MQYAACYSAEIVATFRSMVTDKLKELEAARAKLASLEQSIESERNKELALLPAKYGYSSADDFIDAVRKAGGSSTGAARRGRPMRGNWWGQRCYWRVIARADLLPARKSSSMAATSSRSTRGRRGKSYLRLRSGR